MPLHAIYSGEELTVHFSADAVRNDYGVPGSPVWYYPDNITVDSVEFLGQDVPIFEIPGWMVDRIYELSDEVEFERAE